MVSADLRTVRQSPAPRDWGMRPVPSQTGRQASASTVQHHKHESLRASAHGPAQSLRRPLRNRRKIAPFVPPDIPVKRPGPDRARPLRDAEKAASLNQASSSRLRGAGGGGSGRRSVSRCPDMDWSPALPAGAHPRRARETRPRRHRRLDPLNVRYATDSTDMQLWCTHNAVRYAFVATEGPVILWDFHHCEHLSWHIDTDRRDPPRQSLVLLRGGEHAIRSGRRSGLRRSPTSVSVHGGGNQRLAVDKINPHGVEALERARHFGLLDGEEVMEHARTVKCAGRDQGHAPRRRRLRGGDGAMRAGAHARHDGERSLGDPARREHPPRRRVDRVAAPRPRAPRTNPWFQECSRAGDPGGDLVAFDTDLIGPYGYCCDISRTWLAGAAADQRAARALRAWPRSRSPQTWTCCGRAGASASSLTAKSLPPGISSEPLFRALPRRRTLRRISGGPLSGGFRPTPATTACWRPA